MEQFVLPTYSERFSNVFHVPLNIIYIFFVIFVKEPMSGVGFRLLDWEVYEDLEDFNLTETSGQLIFTMKEACRKVSVRLITVNFIDY